MFRVVVSVPSPVCGVCVGVAGSEGWRSCWAPSGVSVFWPFVRSASSLAGAFVGLRRVVFGRAAWASFGPAAAFRFSVVQFGAGGAVVRVFPVPASWLALPFSACSRCGGFGAVSRPCRACGARLSGAVPSSPAVRSALAASRRAALLSPRLF